MHYAERPLPIGGRGNVLIGALVATMLANLVAVAIEINHLGIINDLDRGRDLSFETVDASDKRVLAGVGLQAIAYITAAVLFVVWFHRAYRNLPRLGVWPIRYDNGWEVGSWFIPVFNFIRPKQIADDIWRGSEPGPGPKRLEDGPRVPPIVHLWWGVCCVAWVLAVVERSLGYEALTLPEQRTAIVITLVACGVYVLAAALAIVVVRKISRRQDAAVEAALAAAPPMPPWGHPGAAYPPAWGQPAPGTPWGPPAPAPAWDQPPPAWGQPPPPAGGWSPPGPEAPGAPPPPPPPPQQPQQQQPQQPQQPQQQQPQQQQQQQQQPPPR